MIKTLSKGLAIGLSLAFALWLVGCGSSSGGGGAPADEGTVTRVANTYAEQCALCHGDGRVADVATVHDITSSSPVVTITGVTIVGGTVTVAFKIFDSDNPLVPLSIPANDIRLTIAKLVPGAGGDSSRWQSYINDTETNAGVGTTPPGTMTVQATYERASANGSAGYTNNLDGTYTYVFQFPEPGGTFASTIDNITDPIAVTYEPSLTHRIAIQVSDNVDNATFDFVPDGVTPLASRRIAVVASCNECHVRLGLHGGDRVNLDYCVTCHNPGTTDANSNNVVDLKVMIHKIHRGAELPSVEGGGEYAIWGHNDSKHDYSTVEFPQPITNCTKCHRNAAESDNWKDVPNTDACGSCHDDVNFATGVNHDGGPQANNTLCATCHPADSTLVNITDAHAIPQWDAAGHFQYNIISVTNAAPGAPGQFMVAPGEFPVIRFSVTDPMNGNAPYDINNDPEFQPGGGARSLRVLVGWFTRDPNRDEVIEDYTHTGSTATPAQPIRIDLLAGAVDNGDGTFTVASTVPIPAGAEGSGVVAMEGHPAVESVPGSGTYDLRVPVTGAVQAVAITDPAPQSRRVVVDAANCNNCHGLLSLHGSNRSNNTQLCVLCHNANATDINVRPADPTTTTDGKVEEAIDFKYMIHSIHAGAAAEHGFRTEGIVVYGYGGSEHDFSHVRLPGEELNLLNCQGCHDSGTNELPDDLKTWPPLPTTINTGADIADPDDDVNITPTASVCSSCHDGITTKTHMADNGGVFDFRAFTTTTSGGGGGGGDQAALCGPGPVSAQPAGHSTRTDCCSCHSPN